MGIFRSVELNGWDVDRLDGVAVRQQHENGNVSVELDVTTKCRAGCEIYAILDGKRVLLKDGHGMIQVDDPKLWWARGYGDQPLYDLDVELVCGGRVIDRCHKRLGLRTLTVSTEPDADGKGSEFCFVLNGVKIFSMGANLVPMDSLLSRVTDRRWEAVVRQAVDANFNTLRVWGGGYYPDSRFYELCDQLGLYVIDESDIEMHGVVNCFGEYNESDFALLAEDPMYEKTVLDRVQRCVIRDKNRPCVLIWSMGNESGYGQNFIKAAKWVKENEPTRLLHYEGGTNGIGDPKGNQDIDLYSRMYPQLDFIREYFPECTRVAAYATTKAIERKMDEELRKLRGDVERRRKAMQELYLDKVSGLIDSAQFFEMNKSFLDEVSSAEARIEKLESELEQQKEKELESARQRALSIVEETRFRSNQLLNELEELKKVKDKEALRQGLSSMKGKTNSTLNKMQDEANPVVERRAESYVLPRPLKAGDTVMLADTKKEGVLMTVPNMSGVCYVQVGMMKIKTNQKNLRLVDNKKKQPTPQKSVGGSVKKQVTSNMNRRGGMELDIRGMMTDEGVLEMERFIDSAQLSGISTVIIIHGKGTGALRAAVQQALKTNPAVKSYRQGAYGEGEAGVTVVELK